ncbi:hypothetical protein AK812_SmicGene13336 [Symbiodinium microadriaticum]|uniref:Uncharacterized protein n=1 Tax=Symbiodinium microadriaticum TaxID=2951 RepID=A0A1Q9E8B9_SYMMI|nr:hypothetical protein AK812_SmicGene13336 [Symbiodinium microadriaticum]
MHLQDKGGPEPDPMSVFWMQFEDVKEYFGAVEICRIHENWSSDRTQVTVFRRTAVDICIWQEKHIAREVGFAVFRKLGPGADGKMRYDLTEYVGRARADDVSEEMILEDREAEWDPELTSGESRVLLYIQALLVLNAGYSGGVEEWKRVGFPALNAAVCAGGYVYRVVPVSFGLAQVQTIETQKVTLAGS